MPLAAPVVAALIGAGATAATTGVSIYEGGQQRDAQDRLAKQSQQAQADALARQNQQQAADAKQAFRGAQPDAQEQVGNSLSPGSLSQLINQLAGNPGNAGEAAAALGLNISGGSGANQANTGGSTGLSDAINHLFGNQQDDGSTTLTAPA